MCTIEQALLFDLFNAFDHIESLKLEYFLLKRPIFGLACAICAELPDSISTLSSALFIGKPCLIAIWKGGILFEKMQVVQLQSWSLNISDGNA